MVEKNPKLNVISANMVNKISMQYDVGDRAHLEETVNNPSFKYWVMFVSIITGLVIASVIGIWVYSIANTSNNAEAAEYELNLKNKTDKYREEYNKIITKLNTKGSDNYSYSKAVNELSLLGDFIKRIEEEDWHNPYAQGLNEDYEKLYGEAKETYKTVSTFVASDFKKRLETFEIPAVDKESTNTQVNNQTNVKKETEASITDYSSPILNKLKELFSLIDTIIRTQSSFNIFSQEEYDDIENDFNKKLEELSNSLKISLEKEANEKGIESADKKYQENIDSLTKELSDKLNKETNDYINKTLESKNNEILLLKSEVEELKKQLASKQSNL